ncbi:MAG: TonB-dependent receptor plug domain-containing protein, partial [Saprospiraceae bacterium]
MKSFYKLFIFFFSITGIVANAQHIQFLNAQNMHPIPQVHIKLEPGLQELTSDPSGILSISNDLEFTRIHCMHPDFESLFLSKEELAQNGFVVLLKSRTNLLDEVLVAATRTDRTRSDLSVQTLQLKRSEIDFQLPSTTADLLESTGSIMVQKSQQGGGSPVMRGFEANKILLVIDGVRMNNAIYRGGHLQNIITVDPLLLEKAELVFGPSSVIYGSDALGGVIHLITRNAQFRNQTNSMISGNALVK